MDMWRLSSVRVLCSPHRVIVSATAQIILHAYDTVLHVALVGMAVRTPELQNLT